MESGHCQRYTLTVYMKIQNNSNSNAYHHKKRKTNQGGQGKRDECDGREARDARDMQADEWNDSARGSGGVMVMKKGGARLCKWRVVVNNGNNAGGTASH